MARNQNRNRVRAASAAHGADGLEFANRPRDFAVAFRLAGGNFQHLPPDGFLKFRFARPVERRQAFRRASRQRRLERRRRGTMPLAYFPG